MHTEDSTTRDQYSKDGTGIDKRPQDSTGLDGLHESGMGLTKAVWDLMVLIKAWDLKAFY